MLSVKKMKVRLFGIFAAAALMLNLIVSSAQTLPLLPRDPAVQDCVFPNGLSCYAVENTSTKGVADISLIKRDYAGSDVVCSHRNVMLSSEVAVDSMLLNIMRRVAADGITADCAVIVSGDIDAKAVMTKLKYMSLMVDSSDSSPIPDHVWDGDRGLSMSVENDAASGLSTVRCHWQLPGFARAKRPTTHYAIYEKAAWELGELACVWVKRALGRENIPYANVSFAHDDALDHYSRESFSIEVTVARDDVEKASASLLSVLSALDRGGAGESDVILAESEFLGRLEQSASRAVMTNEEYTQMCRNAFLYGTALTSDKERLAFFRSKDLAGSSKRKIFAGITSAMIEMAGPSDSMQVHSIDIMLSDTLRMQGPSEVKTKIRTARKDAFSGGTLWTFANGFKVLYRKMPSTGMRLYYSLSMNGGYGNVEGLERGEGAYMSDYLDHCWIAGMKSSYFKDLLQLSGMTMSTKVGLFHTMISGHVEDRNVRLLMGSLLAVANECRPDSSQTDYFARCEALRLGMKGQADIKTAIDALMCPGYRYTSFKTDGGVRKGTFAKAQALFDSMTAKMNDGMLVIVGDMDETELKKMLQLYVGNFKVRNVASRRPSLEYHPVSGWSSYNVEGEEDAATVVITAPLVMTASNHFAVDLAALMLERRLDDVFGPTGRRVKLSLSRNIYPDERFSIMVSISGQCGKEDIDRLHQTLEGFEFTDAELKSCKEYLKNLYAQQAKDPQYWLRVMQLRHLEGKDFTTGASAKIDAVTAQMLDGVFAAMGKGAGIEYITTKK